MHRASISTSTWTGLPFVLFSVTSHATVAPNTGSVETTVTPASNRGSHRAMLIARELPGQSSTIWPLQVLLAGQRTEPVEGAVMKPCAVGVHPFRKMEQ